MQNFLENTAEVAWIILAMIGGVARYLDRYIRTGHSPKPGMLVAHTLVSGFSGYMVAQTIMRFDADWALVAAGVGGYLGTQGLDWLASVLSTKFGGTMPPRRDDDGKDGNDHG